MPVEVLGRLRSDRVFRLPARPRAAETIGRPAKHGGEFGFADPGTWPDPDVVTFTGTSRYGTASATAWDRLHPRLTRRAAWLDYDGDLPVLEGTLIRLVVDHLPGDGDPKPYRRSSPDVGTPCTPGRLTPARVRRGFRNLRAKTTRPAGAPKPTTAGPGRPAGSKNRQRAARHDVGKTN
ncbi:hypothetical protein Acsp02_45060 [Actinoplanes sp. NBRC 103695]|nr:hypothetical protein Acsp02_45060 [Actinoplanes sp. NBRC 103695]